jgi:apolipoprotein D and lipocalin family protein
MTDVYTKYEIIDENTISITNVGIKNNKEKIITGKGKFKNNPNEGWLRISFFWPFYSDYKIIYLDECYQTAIITSDSKDYLWILTRTDKLSTETKQQLLTILKQFNFDTDKLIWSN